MSRPSAEPTIRLKTVALVSTALFGTALLLTACGGGGQIGDTGGTGDAKKMVLIPGVAAEPFYISMECGFREAASAAGYEVDVQAPAKFDATPEKVRSGLRTRFDTPHSTTEAAIRKPIRQPSSADQKLTLIDTQ